MFYQIIFFTLLLLQLAHECSASRGLGFVHPARLINQERVFPSKELKTSSDMKGVVKSRPKESSIEARQEVLVHMQMDSKQIKPTEIILQGTISKDLSMTESQQESYEDDLDEAAGEIIEAKDYVKSRGKSPIHN